MTEVTALMHRGQHQSPPEGMGGGRSQRGDLSEVLNTQHHAQCVSQALRTSGIVSILVVRWGPNSLCE